MTTRQQIEDWFADGVHRGFDFMIVVVDTYDWGDYPVYVSATDDFWAKYKSYDGVNMQRIMEVYDLNGNAQRQLSERRAYHPPPRS